MGKHNKRLLKRIRDLAAYVLLRVAAAAVGILPEMAAVLVGRAFGRLFWLLSPKRRRRALENIERALGGELPKEEIARIARESFVHVGLTVAEILWISRRLHGDKFSFADRFPVDRLDVVKAELAKGRGALAATLHLGNWELFGARLAAGLGEMAALALPGKNRLVSAYVERVRERTGVRLINSEGGVRPMVAAVRRGSLLAFIMDRHVDTAGAHTTFFGRDVATSTAVAALARRLDVPVFIGCSVREGYSFRHRGLIEGPLELVKTDDRESDVLVNTQRFNDHFEAAIRKHPEQWLWVQNRWKLDKKLRRKQGQAAADNAALAAKDDED
ncbi:MAG: hypothetical protein ABIF82_01690 [Planctomycetota bacterium]